MKNLRTCVLLLLLLLQAVRLSAAEADAQPRVLLSYNALQTLAFVAANELVIARKEPKLIYLPWHFDMAVRLSDSIGLALGLVYRYESYQDPGPLHSAKGSIRPKKVWTNFHELFLLAGPRFSLKDTGIMGLFIETKGGLGAARSPVYGSFSALMETKLGYSMAFPSGFALSFAAGLLFNMPFYETHDFAVLWNKPEKNNLIGVLVHQAIPIVDIGIGYTW